MFYSMKHFNVNNFIFFCAKNTDRAVPGRGLCMSQDSLALPGDDRIWNCLPRDETWGRGVFSGIAKLMYCTIIVHYSTVQYK